MEEFLIIIVVVREAHRHGDFREKSYQKTEKNKSEERKNQKKKLKGLIMTQRIG